MTSSNQANKLAYVTGATGCLGRYIVEDLINDGWNVIALHRKTSDLSRLEGVDVEYREVDLYSIDSVRQVVDGGDAFFHVAGNMSYWKPEQKIQWKDNVLATRNLARVARETEIGKFIFTSTGAVWTEAGRTRYEAERMKYAYSRTKRLAEFEVYDEIEKGLNACILQLPIMMGKYDYNGYSSIYSLIKSGKIKYALPGKFNFCHAADISKAHLSAYERGDLGEYYILGGFFHSWQEIFQKMADIVGVDIKMKVAPKPWLFVASHLLNFVSFFTRKRPAFTPGLIKLLDPKRNNMNPYALNVEGELEWSMIQLNWRPELTIDDMIQDCYDWMVETGRI